MFTVRCLHLREREAFTRAWVVPSQSTEGQDFPSGGVLLGVRCSVFTVHCSLFEMEERERERRCVKGTLGGEPAGEVPPGARAESSGQTPPVGSDALSE